MMDFDSLKRKIEQISSQRSRQEGRLEALMTELKRDFGLNSLEEAEKELQTRKADLEEAKTRFEEDSREFREKWSDLLEIE